MLGSKSKTLGLEAGPAKHGMGLFATRMFRPGQVLGEVTGERFEDPDYGSDYCIDLGDDWSLEPGEPANGAAQARIGALGRLGGLEPLESVRLGPGHDDPLRLRGDQGEAQVEVLVPWLPTPGRHVKDVHVEQAR